MPGVHANRARQQVTSRVEPDLKSPCDIFADARQTRAPDRMLIIAVNRLPVLAACRDHWTIVLHRSRQWLVPIWARIQTPAERDRLFHPSIPRYADRPS